MGSDSKDQTIAIDDAGPSPVPGLDWQAFRNYVIRALTGDEAVPASVLIYVNAAVARGERDLERRDHAWWRDFLWRQAIAESLQAVDGAIGELEGLAAWYREQAETMLSEMDQAARRMARRSEFIEEADSIIDGWERDGQLDRERAIEALGKRGVEANERMSDAQLVELLRPAQQRALEEQARDSDRYDDLDRGRQEFEQQTQALEEKARAYKDECDSIMNDPDLSDEERARQLQELRDRVGADVALEAARREIHKQAKQQLDREAEASRDASHTTDEMDMLMAFRDTFNTKSAGTATNEAQPQDQERTFAAEAPVAPGASNG